MKKMNNTSFWTKNFSWKRKCWTKTFRKMKRNELESFVESVERDERRYWKIDWKRWSCSFLNSCYGHIFIISWWLKSKFVTLANFFKTSHLKKLWILKESSKTSHLKNCDFWKCIFQNHSLVIDYHQGVIDYISTDVTLFWILKIKTFRGSANQLQIFCNRLHKFKMI